MHMPIANSCFAPLHQINPHENAWRFHCLHFCHEVFACKRTCFLISKSICLFATWRKKPLKWIQTHQNLKITQSKPMKECKHPCNYRSRRPQKLGVVFLLLPCRGFCNPSLVWIAGLLLFQYVISLGLVQDGPQDSTLVPFRCFLQGFTGLDLLLGTLSRCFRLWLVWGLCLKGFDDAACKMCS